ncbi:MAG: hypothetical protein AABP62_10400 [Planctomycetota bacterium]
MTLKEICDCITPMMVDESGMMDCEATLILHLQEGDYEVAPKDEERPMIRVAYRLERLTQD